MIDLLRQRRSIRKYQDKAISAEHVDLLKEALLRSPSSRNLNPWEFLFIDDKETLADLARSKPHGAAFLAGAPLGVVVCADPEKCDVWIEDCSIASILLQMTAQSLGLGSCWIQIRLRNHDDRQPSEQYIRQRLGLPDNLRILSIIALGHPAEDRPPIPTENLQSGKIHADGW